MARPGVTEAQVFEAITALLAMGAKITVEKIRSELGCGSPNTINRHLRTWRQQPLSQFNSEALLQVKQLRKHCATLEEQLLAQTGQAQSLSQLILERDQKILALEQRLAALNQELIKSQQALESGKAIESRLALEREALLQPLIEAQSQQAEQFREDVKALNEMSLAQVRALSMQAQDQWLEEKLRVRALGIELTKLRSLNKSLEDKLEKAQQVQLPLRKKIAYQQALIAQCLDPKKLETFSQNEDER